MKKIGWWTLAVLLTSVLLGAYPGGHLAAAEKPLRVGAVMMVLTGNYFQIQLGEACKKACAGFGAKATVYGPQSFGDYAQQLGIVEDLITKRVDLILLNPCHPQALVPAVKKAEKAGIPVITIDNNVDSDKVLTYLGTNNLKGSYDGAMYIAKKLGGKGKVAILEGEAGNPNAILRTDGATKAFKEFADIKIVASQNAHWTEEGGLTVMENILQANPDIDAVFCACDNIAFGAAQACKNKGVRPLIVGFDGIPEAIEAVKKGTIDATVAQFPGKMAEIGVRLGLSYVTYMKDIKEFIPRPYPPVIDTGVMVVDKTNVESFKGAFHVF
jgi:ribose transport system substrate-binding protein